MANLFLTPTKIINGEHALSDAKDILKTLGKKALIVTDDMMVKLDNVKMLEAILTQINISYYIYSGINTEPTDTMIAEGVRIYNDERCDFLIAIGGGSPIDSMKAIAMMSATNHSICDHMGKELEFDRPSMVAIPTTAGTGSEATQFTIITDSKTDIKMLLKGTKVIPDVAIIDPQFTMSVPKAITAATGVDALCHAIESYTSKKAQPLSDIFALSATKRIFENLLRCYQQGDDIEARTQMSIASLEAGISFNNASVTIVHGMSRPIGALFHVPHGLSNAMLLETCIKYSKDSIPDKLAQLARYCEFTSSSNDEEAANVFLEKLHTLLIDLNIPSLEAFGVNKEQFLQAIPKMAKDAMDSGSPSNTRKDLSAPILEQLYQSLYK